MIVTACKSSEDGQAVVVRALNPLSKPARQRIEFISDVQSAQTTNLLEEPQQKLMVRGRAVTLAAAPKQIVTLRVALAPLI
jgi:alpha-mannosidase